MTSLYGRSPTPMSGFWTFRRVASPCAASITEVQRLPCNPPGGAPASPDRRTPGHRAEEDQRAFSGPAAWSQRSHHRARPCGAVGRGCPDLRPARPRRRLPARDGRSTSGDQVHCRRSRRSRGESRRRWPVLVSDRALRSRQTSRCHPLAPHRSPKVVTLPGGPVPRNAGSEGPARDRRSGDRHLERGAAMVLRRPRQLRALRD